MYESFFKLKVSPFQLAPDPLFFYDSDTHRNGLIKLRQALRNGNAITAVAGEPGTGKTELMRRFISELDDKTAVVANIPLTSLRSSNILDYVASAFGVINMGFVGDALWSKSALLGKIQQEVSSQTAEGKKFLIFIDNAESLSKSCMKKLLQLCSVKSAGMPLIQCFLFGESTVGQRVNLRGSGNFFSIIKIESLGLEETRRYIEHRLMQAGWQGDPEITQDAFASIQQITEGIPWHINLLCHRLLLQGFLQDTHVIDQQIVSMFADVDQLENEKIENLESNDQQEVSGSDVAVTSTVTSKVVNLNGKQTGREMKGTSFFSRSTQSSEAMPRNQYREKKDSISHFFDSALSVEDTTNMDEEPISIEDVEKAFHESIGEEYSAKHTTTDKLIGESTDELFFPEVNEPIETDAAEDQQSTASIQGMVTNVSADENKMATSILERIFPDTVAMMEEYAQGSYSKSCSMRNATVDSSEDYQQQKDQLLEDDEVVDDYQYLPPQRSPGAIAARASIVTSLAITLVMWVISDSQAEKPGFSTSPTTGSVISRSDEIPRAAVNKVTPSPFEIPDESAHSRARNER